MISRISRWVGAVAVLAILSGCTTTTLPTGRYVSEKDPSVYAMVYKDLIFVTVRAPQGTEGKYADWVWAGNYSVNSLGELEFDMDSSADREWRFYYTFTATNRGILLNDWSNNGSELMRYVAPERLPQKPEPAVRYEED